MDGPKPGTVCLTRLHEASVSLIWRDSDERMAQFVARLNDRDCNLSMAPVSGMCWTPPLVKIRLPTG